MLVNTRVDIFPEKDHTLCMNGPEAVSCIKELGLSQARFARMVGLHQNAITKWANGAQPHGPAVTLLRLLKERPELIPVVERISGEG